MAHHMAVPGFGMVHENGFHGVQVLTSWKDIANYMGKGVRTVQRWEQEFGLPVRRPMGSNRKAVMARPHDLDAWVALRCRTRVEGKNGATPPPQELCALSALAAELETSRLLREENRSARAELHQELAALHKNLDAICRDLVPQNSALPAREN